MKEGFEAGAVKLWVDDAEKYAGPVTPPDEFPPNVDRFNPMDMVQAYASEAYAILTEPQLMIRLSSATEENNYNIWIDYINNRRFKHLQGLKNFRSIAVEQPTLTGVEAPDTNNIIEILVICVSAVLIFLLLRCCLHCVGVCQERKGYEEF